MIRPLGLLALLLAAPAGAQSMHGMAMHGMAMHGMTMPAPKKAPAKTVPRPRAVPHPGGHGGMPGMAMPGMAMPGHDAATMPAAPAAEAAPVPRASGTALPAGDAPPPPVPDDHYADRFFAPTAMADARLGMMREDGGQIVHQILFNLAEVQARRGRDGYRWDAEGFVGGDIDRLWIKSEGEGAIGGTVDTGEVQALWSHAIGPYYDLQAGVRQDIRPSPARTYATIGFEGLAPYQFETGGALFLSTRGDLLGRLEGWYDQRITQRLILQPRAELNLAAQDVREDRIGTGLVDAELGLRLRYEIRRSFAPYMGVSWERRTGRSADYARAAGDRVATTGFVAGIRTWF